METLKETMDLLYVVLPALPGKINMASSGQSLPEISPEPKVLYDRPVGWLERLDDLNQAC